MSAFWVTITEKGGKPQKREFEQNEVTIGRVQGNDIVLPKGNISKRHSRIVLRDGKFIIVDLKSTNGTYVNGKRINSPQVLKGVDKIYIGDFTLQVESEGDVAEPDAPEPEAEPELEPAMDASVELDEMQEALQGADDILFDNDEEDLLDLAEGLDDQVAPPPAAAPPPPVEAPPPPVAAAPPAAAKPKKKKRPANGAAAPALDVSPAVIEARRKIYDNVRKVLKDKGAEDKGKKAVETVTGSSVDAFKQKSPPPGVNLDVWKREIVEEICGIGAIGTLLEDDGVSEIYVNGPYRVYVRRDGEEARPEPAMFSSPEALAHVVSRMLEGSGELFDAEHPICEARLPDGTRVNAVHQSHAVGGPLVTVTRHAAASASVDDLVGDGVLSEGMAEFLDTCVRTRRNVVVCAGPGADLAALMGALAGKIPSDERIVTVEHVSELHLPQPHVVTLEAKAPSSMRPLVANALRMVPDRLVVHELAGSEALEVAIAMGGGQEGTLVSTYAASAHDCLARLTTMVCMGREEIPARVARQQIADSVDVVVCLTRFADGQERVTEIVEVTGADVDLFTTQDIFAFKREGGGGRFVAKGEPRFYQELKKRGEAVNMAIFRDGV